MPLRKRSGLGGGKYADFCLLLAWTVVPENGILRHPETGLIAGSPFYMVLLYLFLYFCHPWLYLWQSDWQY